MKCAFDCNLFLLLSRHCEPVKQNCVRLPCPSCCCWMEEWNGHWTDHQPRWRRLELTAVSVAQVQNAFYDVLQSYRGRRGRRVHFAINCAKTDSNYFTYSLVASCRPSVHSCVLSLESPGWYLTADNQGRIERQNVYCDLSVGISHMIHRAQDANEWRWSKNRPQRPISELHFCILFNGMALRGAQPKNCLGWW